jgi:hypothetical protein
VSVLFWKSLLHIMYCDLFAGVNVVAGEFRITNENFEPSLNDETSADFKQLAAQITQQVNINISHIFIKTIKFMWFRFIIKCCTIKFFHALE